MTSKAKFAKVIALAFFAGALPFFRPAPAHAQESEWLDDYSAPVGFTYGAQATVQTTYLWRGLYVGALNLQTSGNVGYGGLYFNMWWNVGTADWRFKTFQPEVDLTLGFSRWGLDASVTFIHSFNCGFFDFSNRPEGGNALELGLRYTVSSKLPLSIYWATRLAAADGYLNDAGDTIRAYSTYIELSYTHHFPHDISLYGAIGITPWRSMYTGFQRNFAVQNIEFKLRKDWSVSEHCGLMIQSAFSINPSALAADLSTAQWHPYAPGNQSINFNFGFGVYLK